MLAAELDRAHSLLGDAADALQSATEPHDAPTQTATWAAALRTLQEEIRVLAGRVRA